MCIRDSPYPELAAQVLRFVGEFDGSRMGYGEDDAQAVENIAQQLHDPVPVSYTHLDVYKRQSI